MNTSPVNAPAIAAQVMTCPSRVVPTWAELYRLGDDVPYAVVPVVAFFVVPPRAAGKDGDGNIVTPERGAELRLRVYAPDFGPPRRPEDAAATVPPGIPVKVAGVAGDRVPNAGDAAP